MDSDQPQEITTPGPLPTDTSGQDSRVDLQRALEAPKYEKYARFGVAALSSIPWIGGVIGASAALHAESEQGRANTIIHQRLEDHHVRIQQLRKDLE